MTAAASPRVLIEALSVASLAAISYASTNLDNFIVLSAYGAKPGYRPVFVKLTFVFVCLTVLLASFVLAQAADILPAEKLRYLGLIPMGLGAYQAVKLIIGGAAKGEASGDAPANTLAFSAYLGFALVLLANSGDTIGVMTPLLADLRSEFVLICFAAAVAMAIAASSLANVLASHPPLRSRLEKLAKWGLPFLLIGIGVLIFTDKPSDVFVE